MSQINDEEYDEETINIMTLGNSSVGKTSFIIKYIEDTFQEVYLATVGIDFKIKNIIIKDKHYKLYFYDTTGQEKYKSLSFNIIKNAHGILLMYDVTNESSFESIPEWIRNIKELKGDNFPMILLGNKIDVINKRKISKEKGEDLAEENKIDFFETSNKEGINIEEATLALVNKIIKINKPKQKKDLNSSILSGGSTSFKSKKKCC